MYLNGWQGPSGAASILTNCLLSLVFFLVFVQPNSALATGPRTSALGGENSFFEDDSNVLRWYGSLPEYGNQIVIGTGHHDLAGQEVSWADSKSGFFTGVQANLGAEGKEGTAAIFFHEQMRDSDISTSIEADPGNSFTIMYGRKIGQALVGLALKQGSWEWNSGVAEDDDRAGYSDFNRTTVGFGIRADLSQKSYFDVSFDLRRLHWFNLGKIPGENIPDPWHNFNFRARVFIAVGNKMAVVPAVELWSEEYLDTRGDFLDNEIHINKMQRLGCGLNYFPNSDNFMLVSADYFGIKKESTNPLENEFSKKLHKYKIHFATESRWNHWLTLRASAGWEYFMCEDNFVTTTDLTEAVFPLSCGAGFHLGGFDLDVALASHEPGLLNPNWDVLFSSEPSTQAVGTWFSASFRYLF